MKSLKARLKLIMVSLSLFGLMVFPAGCGAESPGQSPDSPSFEAADKQQPVKQPGKPAGEPVQNKKTASPDEGKKTGQPTPGKNTGTINPTQGTGNKPGGANTELKPENAPKIPHGVKDNSTCLKCHKDGKKGAQITPHPEQPNCLKCHNVK